MNLAGRRLELRWKTPEAPYAGECRVDDAPVDYAACLRLDIRDASGTPVALPTAFFP